MRKITKRVLEKIPLKINENFKKNRNEKDLVDVSSKNCKTEIIVDEYNSFKDKYQIPFDKNLILQIYFKLPRKAKISPHSINWFILVEDKKEELKNFFNQKKVDLDCLTFNNYDSFKILCEIKTENFSYERITTISVVNPKISKFSIKANKNNYSFGDTIILSANPRLLNSSINKEWTLSYQWFYDVGGNLIDIKNNLVFSGCDSKKLSINLNDSMLNNLKIGCKVIVSNSKNLNYYGWSNNFYKIIFPKPSFKKIKINSKQVSKLNRTKIGEKPILTSKFKITNLSKQNTNTFLRFEWLRKENKDWVVISNDEKLLLEPQMNSFINNEYKICLKLFDKNNKLLDSKESNSLIFRPNHVYKPWDSEFYINKLKNNDVTIFVRTNLHIQKEDCIEFKWFFNGQVISKDNFLFIENKNSLVIRNCFDKENIFGEYICLPIINGIQYSEYQTKINFSKETDLPFNSRVGSTKPRFKLF